MREWFSSRKLKQKVRLLFGALLSAYLLVFAALYGVVVQGSLESYIKDTNYNMMRSIGNNLTGEMENIGTMSKLIMDNPDILAYLRGTGQATSAGAYNALHSIYGVTTSFKNISSVYIFKSTGEYIDIANEVTKIDDELIFSRLWQQEIIEKSGANVIRVNGNGAFQTVSGKPVISFVRQINDVQTQKPIGFLAVNCTMNLLTDTYAEMENTSKRFGYYEETGQFLCGDVVFQEMPLPKPDKNEDFSAEKTGPASRELVFGYRIPNMPLVVAEYEELDYFNYLTAQSLFMIAAVIILTLIVILLLGMFISVYITTPIERLSESMSQVKMGWLKRVSIKLPDDEIGHLKDSYNNMLIEINRLIEELVLNEKSLQQSELEALQEQIKPHFLYNTLDTIGYLALESPREEVYDAIETLGHFYRKFLSKGSKEITVKEELQIIRDYLKLQKLRYEDIFEEVYEIAEDVQSLRIPKLILQPLVENSLYHGVRLKGETGTIRIRAYKQEHRLMLSVFDTGVGMTKEQMQRLMKEDGKSFGLRKTIERIQNYYNEEQVYEICSEVGVYCEVILKLPVNMEE